MPSSDEWQQMAKHYGGIGGDSADTGRAAFTALLSGGFGSSESYRRGGIGRRLFETAEKEAQKVGCLHVAVDTMEFQAKTRRNM